MDYERLDIVSQMQARKAKLPCQLSASARRTAIEQLLESGGVEVTVTFRPYFRSKYTDAQIYKIFKRYITQIVCKRYPKMSCVFNAEISKAMMLHYHGVVLGLDKTQYSDLAHELNKLCGRTEIMMVRNTQNYLEYMEKEPISQYCFLYNVGRLLEPEELERMQELIKQKQLLDDELKIIDAKLQYLYGEQLKRSDPLEANTNRSETPRYLFDK